MNQDVNHAEIHKSRVNDLETGPIVVLDSQESNPMIVDTWIALDRSNGVNAIFLDLPLLG